MPDPRRSRSPLVPLHSHPSDPGLAPKLLGGVLLFLVMAAPWPFGGVEMTRWLWPLPLLVVACWTWLLGRSSAPSPIAPWAAIPVLLALAYAAFQLTPLSGELLNRLSPQALHHWRNAQALTQPVGEDVYVSAPISLEPEGGRLQMTWLALGLCVFILSAQFLRSVSGMLGLFGVSTVVGALLAIFAVIQSAQRDNKLYGFFELMSRTRPFGPFVNRNHGGAFMDLCLAGAVAFFWYMVSRDHIEEEEGRWTLESEPFRTRIFGALRHLSGLHILAFAAVVFVLGGLVASLSRGAMAAAAAGLAGALVASRLQQRDIPRTTPLGLYVAAVVLLSAAASFVYLIGAEQKAFARFNTLVNEADSGQKSRARHWHDMLPAVQDYWKTGSGLGSYVHVHRIYTPNNYGLVFEHADNTYLELLVELGVVGIALVVLFILLCVRAIFVVLRRDRSPVGRALGVAAAFVLGSQVLHHAVDFPLYSPANLILFAAWMGAVCGRAGRLASAARTEGKSMRFISLPLGRWQAAGALPTGLLLALGVWGWWESSVQERIAWTLREHRRRPATETTPLLQANAWVQELDQLAEQHPHRADLQRQLAERWIDRCRVQAKDAVLAKDPKQSAKEIWDKSDLMVLYMQIFEAARRGQGAILESVRNSPAVSENLPRAKEHLVSACQLSPLFIPPRLRLALMPYLLDSPSKRELLVDQAAALAPGDADVQFQVGLLEFHADNPDRRAMIIPAWKKSLEISQNWVRPILFHVSNWIGVERALNEVLPPDPLLLVNVADQLLSDPKNKKNQANVFQRALQVLPDANISKADRNEIAGRAHVGLGQFEKAASCFEQAAQESKTRPYVWLNLGDCYEKLGKKTEAARAVGVAAGLLPGRGDIVQRALKLRDDAEKGNATPNTPSTPPTNATGQR